MAFTGLTVTSVVSLRDMGVDWLVDTVTSVVYLGVWGLAGLRVTSVVYLGGRKTTEVTVPNQSTHTSQINDCSDCVKPVNPYTPQKNN
jgi:hypothetical protein